MGGTEYFRETAVQQRDYMPRSTSTSTQISNYKTRQKKSDIRKQRSKHAIRQGKL